jgi:hypothetical protein
VNGSSRPPARLGASLVAALIIALGPLLWLWFALWRASYLALGRDQGIFQGIAWSMTQGDKLYRDLREINGPLVDEIHLLARLFGGIDAHVLRSFDLIASGLVFAFVGATLPLATGRVPRARPRLEHLAWAVAGAGLLLGQYVAIYSYWDFTQRESFYDWFILGALACDLRARAAAKPARARGWLIAAGALSITPWFGKPTCALFTLVHLLLIACSEREVALSRVKQLLAFGLGMVLGALPQLVFLLMFCDIPAFVRSYLFDNPRYYVYIWPRGLSAIVTTDPHAEYFPLPIALALAMLALIGIGNVSRRMLGIALLPLLGIGLDLLQNKAFPYHLHPVTAGAALLALALTCHAGTTSDDAVEGQPRVTPLWAIALGCVIAYSAARQLIDSQSLHADWAPREGATAAQRASAPYLKHFDRSDFAASALQQSADFLQRYTRPGERIQLYGMDPYLLALAQRRSATPYLYDIDVNPEAVLQGIEALGGSVQATAFAKALANRHASDLAARIRRSPPAAFVLFDNAPFTFPRSGLVDFCAHVPAAAPFLAERYIDAERFGTIQIMMRRDLWPARKPKAAPAAAHH